MHASKRKQGSSWLGRGSSIPRLDHYYTFASCAQRSGGLPSDFTFNFWASFIGPICRDPAMRRAKTHPAYEQVLGTNDDGREHTRMKKGPNYGGKKR